MIDLKNYVEIFNNLPGDVKAAEVNAEQHDRLIVSVGDGKVSDIQFSQSTELFIRVQCEKSGYYYTQNADEDAYAAFNKAYKNCAFSDSNAECRFNQNLNKSFESQDSIMDPVDLRNLALSIEKRFSESIPSAHIEITLKSESFGMHTVNSLGLHISSQRPVYVLSVSASSEYNDEIINCTSDCAASDPEKLDIDYLINDVKERLRMQSSSYDGFVSGTYPVILSNEAVYNLFVTAWQEFSAQKYISGDSVYTGLLNQKIASPALSLYDDPYADGKGYFFESDCEGSCQKNTDLINDGVLCGLMSNLKSANSLGIDPSGNAGRKPLLFGNIATDILVTPSNFCVKKGDADIDEMKSEMRDGVYIFESFDVFHSLNIASGDFCIPCFGMVIKDGEEMGCVKGMAMSGNIKDLLNNIEKVGNKQIIRPMVYLENYGIGSCAVKVSALSLSAE